MYSGPALDDPAILSRLPVEYRRLLEQVNGYIAYGGGLHVRGACVAPEWHSLRAAWEGPNALHRLFPVLQADDVPFGQDALGDQFVLRGGVVHRLRAETGDLESLDVDLADFDRAVRLAPVEYLALGPLEEFRAEGGALEPGQLLNVYPPFCVAESARGVSLRAVPAGDRLRFLSSLAAQLRALPDGAPVEFTVEPPRAAI